MNLEPTSLGPNWWTSLSHGGLLMAPAMVDKFFGDDVEPLPGWKAETLRRAVTRRAESGVRALLDTVFVQVLGYDANQWNRNPASDQWSHRLIKGETERPHRVFLPEVGDPFPVFTEKPEIRIGYHRGRKSVANVVEWLRKANLKVALLATEQQWRLIYAGSDFEAWCEWNLDLWFEAGQPAPQVEALRRLLGPTAVGKTVVDAIQDSRRGQAELTSVLGERVRQAVEKLIQASAANLENLNVLPPDIYLAATRMIMRCVVALFAEGKGMLGRDMPAYHDSYGIQGLREQLESLSQGRRDALQDTQFAWPRLVALFRLIYTGSLHPQLTTMRYGGTLFEPGNLQSRDAVLRAVAALETSYPCPRDRDVYDILLLLTRTYVRVSQGRGARNVPTPVDFSTLDTEYIGILYEGLLDYDLKRADEPVVFIRMGDEPALRVSDLEGIAPNKLRDIFGKLNKKTTLAVSEDEGDGENDEVGEAGEGDQDEEGETLIDDPLGAEYFDDAAVGRAHAWAIAAVKAAGRVRVPRTHTQAAAKKYEEDVKQEARSLFSRIVRTGDWYLVRFGNTRKGSGTFYTRRELAGPTVRRTLAPLIRDQFDTPLKPEEILAVKVCDPAVGSGSFLISALRYMTSALFDSLHVHSRIFESGGNRCYDLGVVAPECLPDGDDFEERLRARLRRHVVERCLYGVDLNPLAIELARMSLWIETMDPRLPFGFLDHKLKPGNALVGCWFNRFEDYPVMAWLRDAGEGDHRTEDAGISWTARIADCWSKKVKPDLAETISRRFQPQLPGLVEEPPGVVQQRMAAEVNLIHDLPVYEVEDRKTRYLELRREPGFLKLMAAFDLWTALWFWPADRLDKAPLPSNFLELDDDVTTILELIRDEYRFFHWELEFPDVFFDKDSGFDVVLGNPPWDTMEPKAKEFFSNFDPLYRSYGLVEARGHQKRYLTASPELENQWLKYRYFFAAFANFHGNAADPRGVDARISFTRSPKKNSLLQEVWASMGNDHQTYSDPNHPFGYQGGGKVYTYKMFCELGYRLLKIGGRLGMIVPSGIYSDQGSAPLRRLFLQSSSWEWLFGFENRDKIFDIHRSFKFNPLIVQKGGQTRTIRAAFMHHSLSDWENAEKHAVEYAASQLFQFSPESNVLLEIQSERDLQILQQTYSIGVRLGDKAQDGWQIRSSRDFSMGDDAGVFRSRLKFEEEGFVADEYGYWRSAEEGRIAVPFYQGVMIGPFRSLSSNYERRGLRGTWVDCPDVTSPILPQYLMSETDAQANGRFQGSRIVFCRLARATDSRTVIASLVGDFPSGDSLTVMQTSILGQAPLCLLAAVFGSLVHDWLLRFRVSGTNVSTYYLQESVLPRPNLRHLKSLGMKIARLSFTHARYAREWIMLRDEELSITDSWKSLWAVSESERARLHACIEAEAALMYGLSFDDFAYILRDCDHPQGRRQAETTRPKTYSVS